MRRERYITEIGIRRRRFRFLIASLISIGIFTAIFFLVVGFFLYFPFFRVRSVKIEGLSYIPEEKVWSLIRARAMAGSTVEHFLGLRNMLVWPDKMDGSDLAFLPEAKSIDLRKNYLSGALEVRVEERPHTGIWCFRAINPSSCYWFDENGLITRTPYTEGNLILVINDYSRSSIPSNEPVIKEEYLGNLFSIFSALEQMKVTPKEVRLEKMELAEVKVPTFEGPDLFFSLRFPASNAPASFTALLQKTKLSELEYVDFRVENRIYYK